MSSRDAKASTEEPAQRPRLPASELRENIPCILCNTDEYVTLFSDPPFRIVRCAECGLVYTLPRLPTERIMEMYQVGYWRSAEARNFGYTDYLRDRDRYLRTFRLRSKVIDRYKTSIGRVLDIGCAAGFFLKVMQEKGWETTGVEISAFMADFARTELNLENVFSGTLEEQQFEAESFDVITLWDVIEHLENPRSVLAMTKRLLKKDGIVVLETQNVESVFARLMGRRWHHYKFEEHLCHFSPKTLSALLALEHFAVLDMSSRRAGKYVTMNFALERSARIHTALPQLLLPLRWMGNMSLYINPMDEMIVVAGKA
jgi:2-polyprenyl-3-methyl-5-hydroxy-6-metoxy-1,4-benzoquinol methylase